MHALSASARFWRFVWLAILPLASCLVGRPAHAMKFTLVQLAGDRTEIDTSGPILPGDFHRLLSFVDTMEKVRHLAGIVIDSPGGLVVEAEKIAGAVRDMQLPVAVPDGGLCASACVLVFAASPRRAVGLTARIGLHRASRFGQENAGSLGATDGMAVHFEHYGVPAAIVAKMRQTAPGGITWLSAADLATMHVQPYKPAAR